MTREMIVTPDDAVLLTALVDHAERRADARLREDNDDVAQRHARTLPAAVLNTVVDYEDLGTGVRSSAALVHPASADAGRGRVSVLSPVGRALLGRRVGHEVEVQLPNGDARRLMIVGLREEVTS